MNDIERDENIFIDDYKEIDDWLLQFQMLMEMIPDAEEVPEEERSDDNRIKSCQSGVWIDYYLKDGRIFLREYSESLIIRGVLAVYVTLVSGRLPEEVAEFEPRFVRDTTIKDKLGYDMNKGFEAMVKKVREYAEGVEPQC